MSGGARRLCGISCDRGDVAAGDADIGEVAIAEHFQLGHRLVIGAVARGPGSDGLDEAAHGAVTQIMASESGLSLHAIRRHFTNSFQSNGGLARNACRSPTLD